MKTLAEIQSDTAAEKVRLAMLVGKTRHLLLRRLREAQSVLKDEYRRLFTKNSRFDFDNKRLISPCGKYALQWQLRPDPSKPEDYDNQQTTVGSIFLNRIEA